MAQRQLPVALARIADEIDESRARVLRLVADVSQPAADWRAHATAWSVGQVIDHLIRAEAASARVIAGLAKRAVAAPPYPADLSEFAWQPPTTDDTWDVMVPDPSAEPEFGRPIETLRAELAAQRALTARAIERLTTFDPRAVTVPHVLIDTPLNLAQWGRFIAYHLRVHARQIEEILANSPI
jgi:hypothetical protein